MSWGQSWLQREAGCQTLAELVFGNGVDRGWNLSVHSDIPLALSALLRAWTAREQWVLNAASEQPIAAAVSATSISSQLTHQESLALTARQSCDLLLDLLEDLGAAGGVFGALRLPRVGGRDEVLQQIEISVFVDRIEIAEVGEQGAPGLLAAEPVERAIRQDALEQHRQLGRGLVPVVLGQLHHAVLHDIEGRFFIPHG
ncbi:hypothetical protein DdX_22096 [Ditylenchus destructor]|uniref:Uncharacterized protein n=1 Tax=Ditylenchus destructor TaxID=166010 RepID=A0AAD4MEJ7_9BILA|nr:hypothetical protein DdX_22096 [Ditylenchus destructor]